MAILVTGGAGFIGSAFVRLYLKRFPDTALLNLDALTYCGSKEAVAEASSYPGYLFHHGDICDRQVIEELFCKHKFETVYNFAAESHVDRSIEGPDRFVLTNVLGTQVLLEAARKHGVKRFVQVSTDEVYGSLGNSGFFSEESALNPSSPYSASKAAADLLCLAYFKTYNLPVVITRSSNAYGPFQFPEKLIPVLIDRALSGKPLPLYGDGKNVRTWTFVDDNCEAILLAGEKGVPGEMYNISSEEECSNLEMARLILRTLGLPENRIEFVQDRPGHDWRYALKATRLKRDLNWKPKMTLSRGIPETVAWYQKNVAWVAAMKDRLR